MDAHPRHPTTEARPTAVTSQRSTDGGPPRLHTREAWPLTQLVVLDNVDLVHEFRCGGSLLKGRSALTRVDQPNSGTVDPGNGIGSELGNLVQEVEHAAGAGHHPGQTAQPDAQVDFVRFPLGGGQFGLRWWFATRLVVGHV